MTADTTIRWGILGAANIARKRFIPGVSRTSNGVVAAIASRDGAKAREAAAALGIPRAYDSYDALIADPDIDAIYNPLPNSLHAEWTLKAVAVGKPVLCEKPLAIGSAQAMVMIDAARSAGVLLMEAFMYRFHPQHARVRALIDDGAIGDVRAVRANFTFLLEPFNPQNVRLQRDLAGGALMDVGCYCVNAARMLFGEEPTWASAQADMRDQFGVEVALAGMLGFSDRRMATFDCGFRASGQGAYAVVGTTGQIDVPNAFVPAQADTIVRVTSGGATHDETIGAVDQYALEAEAFAAALLHGTPLALPADDALGTLRAVEALHQSAAAGGIRVEVSQS